MKILVNKSMEQAELVTELDWLKAQGHENLRSKAKGSVTEVSFLATWPSEVLFDRGYRPAGRRRVRVATEVHVAGTKAQGSLGMRSSSSDEEKICKREESLFKRASPGVQEAIIRWRKLSRSEQLGRIGGKRAKGPVLSSAAPKSRTSIRLNCAYCNQFGSPRILVIGKSGYAFLCGRCFERGREYSRLPDASDAMHKAYGRRRKY